MGRTNCPVCNEALRGRQEWGSASAVTRGNRFLKAGTRVAFLASMNTKQPTDPTETPKACTSAPHEGYLDDDFARFRTARLKKLAAPTPAPEETRAEMFFGTSKAERRSATARLRDDRTHRILDQATATAATRQLKRRRRRPAPPIPKHPGQDDPERSPPHGVDVRRIRAAERRAS